MPINWEGLKEREKLYLFAAELLAKQGKIGKVIDIASGDGAGTAQIARAFPQADVFGLDSDEPLIERAREKFGRVNLRFILGDARRTEFADDYFDALISFHTIEHFSEEDQVGFFKELKRILKPGGLLIICTPDREVWEIQEIAGTQKDHIKELDQREFISLTSRFFSVKGVFGQGMLKGKMSRIKKIINIAKKLDIFKLRKKLHKNLTDKINVSTQPIELDFSVKPMEAGKASIVVLVGEKTPHTYE
ncbi:MAG: class I SAM-dependent methyltransferase [Patescibacteria group bacterium]